MDVSTASERCAAVLETVGEAVVADRSVLETALVGVLARGHVLLEDVPGTGKTLTARSLANALGLSFSRIQFTPDLLPADITGSYVYDEATGEFDFAAGPVFANVVLADEINRATPKTQSALLEAMEEGQVTVEGETHSLPDPFLVIATQNPVESEGTFPLPTAQVDRFLVRTSLGYPDSDGERELLRRRLGRRTRSPTTDAVLDHETVRDLREAPEGVRVDDDVLGYIIDLARRTRTDSRVEVGVSPRGTQRLLEAARARATLDGREYVTPDHVADVARATLAHRLVLSPEARVDEVDPADVVSSVLDSVSVPTVE